MAALGGDLDVSKLTNKINELLKARIAEEEATRNSTDAGNGYYNSLMKQIEALKKQIAELSKLNTSLNEQIKAQKQLINDNNSSSGSNNSGYNKEIQNNITSYQEANKKQSQYFDDMEGNITNVTKKFQILNGEMHKISETRTAINGGVKQIGTITESGANLTVSEDKTYDTKQEIALANELGQVKKFIAEQELKLSQEQYILDNKINTSKTSASKEEYKDMQALLELKKSYISSLNSEIAVAGENTTLAKKHKEEIISVNREIALQQTKDTIYQKNESASRKEELTEIKQLNSLKKFAADQEMKLSQAQYVLDDKMNASNRNAHSEEYLTMKGLLSTKASYVSMLNQEIKTSGKNTIKAREYKEQIVAINREIALQQTKINVLEKGSLSFWDKITIKAKEYFNYAVAAMALQQATQLIRSMVDEVVQLDAALVELQKVTDLEGDALEDFTEKAYAAGEAVAATGREMIEAATEFAKAGYNTDEALELGEVAMMYTNIADETITAAEASEFMIAQMKAFNLTAEDSMHIIDALNEVANNFAVSSADIADNMGNSSAVMAAAGNSYEQMIGLMTAGTEITRDASRVSNGLKSITLNLQGMDDEGNKSLELMSSMEDLFSKLGLSVYDSNGNLKNTYDLLAELAPVYNSATTEMKSFITETIAGKLKFA